MSFSYYFLVMFFVSSLMTIIAPSIVAVPPLCLFVHIILMHIEMRKMRKSIDELHAHIFKTLEAEAKKPLNKKV